MTSDHYRDETATAHRAECPQIWAAVASIAIETTSTQIGGSARVLPDLLHY